MDLESVFHQLATCETEDQVEHVIRSAIAAAGLLGIDYVSLADAILHNSGVGEPQTSQDNIRTNSNVELALKILAQAKKEKRQ